MRSDELVARFERRLGEMQQFSAAMAHEIRTPLTAMRLEMELALTAGRSPEDLRFAIANQVEQIDKLTCLLGQLLTLARADAGEVIVDVEPLELGALVLQVVDALEPVAAARDVSLTCVACESVTISADRGWIERLLLNLLDNAIKFTPPFGSVAAFVTHECGRARLVVQDSGIGIRSDALPRIFDRFYRVDSSRFAAAEGAGLGLSLVKWIAERHRATVSVISEPGQGSTFRVDFPLAAMVSESEWIAGDAQPLTAAAPY